MTTSAHNAYRMAMARGWKASEATKQVLIEEVAAKFRAGASHADLIITYGVSPSTIHVWLRRAEERGLIVRDKRRKPKGART